eukprot:2957928-Amphidinium_carterae.1
MVANTQQKTLRATKSPRLRYPLSGHPVNNKPKGHAGTTPSPGGVHSQPFHECGWHTKCASV